MKTIKRKIKATDVAILIMDCIFAFFMMVSFCTCTEWAFWPWMRLMVLTVAIGAAAFTLRILKKKLNYEYLSLRKDAKAFKARMKKNAELLTTDGLCSGPWDRATSVDESSEYLFTAKIRGREYGSCVQAININEAIGIYLINNPEVSFSDISLVKSFEERMAAA